MPAAAEWSELCTDLLTEQVVGFLCYVHNDRFVRGMKLSVVLACFIYCFFLFPSIFTTAFPFNYCSGLHFYYTGIPAFQAKETA